VNAPFVPEGAPRRPGQISYFVAGLLAGTCAIVGFLFSAYSIFGAIGFLGAGIALCVPFAQRHHFDRIGWYERREVVVPELPFQMSGEGQCIIFGTEGITFSGFLMRDRTITYAQIRGVCIDCAGRCLVGIEVQLSDNSYFNAATKPQRISDWGDGERTRTALAILRRMAPPARFTGPTWVEEGWVPRLGFSHPAPD